MLSSIIWFILLFLGSWKYFLGYHLALGICAVYVEARKEEGGAASAKELALSFVIWPISGMIVICSKVIGPPLLVLLEKTRT